MHIYDEHTQKSEKNSNILKTIHSFQTVLLNNTTTNIVLIEELVQLTTKFFTELISVLPQKELSIINHTIKLYDITTNTEIHENIIEYQSFLISMYTSFILKKDNNKYKKLYSLYMELLHSIDQLLLRLLVFSNKKK